MLAIVFLVFAGALGIMDAKTEIFGIEAIYWCMALMGLAYLRFVYKNRKNLGNIVKDSTVKWLIAFEICGAVMVAVSMLGFNTVLAGSDLLMIKSYVPRQAIYLYFMPAVVVLAEPEYKKIITSFMDKFQLPLFAVIYIVNIVKHKFALSIIPLFVLVILSLYKPTKYKVLDWLMFAIIVLTPVASGGELTNLALRALYVPYFVFAKNKKAVTVLIGLGAACCVAMVFVLPFFAEYITPHLDANSAWRLNFWNDELMQLVQSKGIGVGFGTSYATYNFVGNQPSILRSPYDPVYRQATVEYLMMTTGPHNSLVSLAFRMGIAGIVTFVGFLVNIFTKAWKNIEETSAYAFFAFFAAIVIISVNVGLESPVYLLSFVLGIAVNDLTNDLKVKTKTTIQ